MRVKSCWRQAAVENFDDCFFFLPACAVLETDAPCLISQDLFDIITVVKLIVKAWGDIHFASRISILNHNNVIRLEECTPAKW
jgi:hypothetical protein